MITLKNIKLQAFYTVGLLILFFFAPLIAFAEIYYVNPDGDNSNNGLLADLPFETINHALEQAQAGDTVQLASGLYIQDIVSVRDGSSNSPIIITGPEDAIVNGDGTSNRIVQIFHSFNQLDGFTIDGKHSDVYEKSSYRDKLLYVHGNLKGMGLGDQGYGIDGLKITNMHLKNAGGECVRLRYFITNAEVAYNTIEDCGIHDFVFNDGGKNGEAIYLGTSSSQWGDGKNPTDDPDVSKNNHFHHNTFNTNGNECIEGKEGTEDNIIEHNICRGQKDSNSGGFVSRGTRNIFRYNTVENSAGAGFRLGGHTVDGITYGTDTEIYENTITDNQYGAIKVMVIPQEKICGNTLSGNGSGDGSYGDQFNPAEDCSNPDPDPDPEPESEPEPEPEPSPNPNSLANSNTLMSHSDNFSEGWEIEKLWDGCYEGDSYNSNTCTAGGRDIDNFSVQFDFEEKYNLSQIRLFGDAEGNWVSKKWDLKYKNNSGSWVTAFQEKDCFMNNWATEELSNIKTQYIEVKIFGDETKYQTQARELEVFGTKVSNNNNNENNNQGNQGSSGNENNNPNDEDGDDSEEEENSEENDETVNENLDEKDKPNQSLINNLKVQINNLLNELSALLKVNNILSLSQKSVINNFISQSQNKISDNSDLNNMECNFYRSLKKGMVGKDVKCLQKFLNQKGFLVSTSGWGSLGNESRVFGQKTKQALMKWQNAYLGLTHSSIGYWGKLSIDFYKNNK